MMKSKEEIEGLGNLYLINETRKWVGDDIPDVYTQDDIIKAVAWGYDEGFYDATKWHYPSKGEYPTDGEETLIIFKHRGEKVFKVDKYTKGGWLFSPKPIAWMPLPPPPQEEV